MSAKLTVLITNYNTAEFVETSLYALERLTEGPYRVLINDNGSSLSDVRRLAWSARRFRNVFIHFRDSRGESASMAHGRALDALMELVDTPYTAVLDSDAVVLARFWDRVLMERMTGNIKIAGTPLGAGWSGEKPHDFPFQFAVLFDTETFRRLGVSWRPKDNFSSGAHDTAWQLKPKYTEAGFAGLTLDVKNTRYEKTGPFGDVVCTEYYLRGINGIFASHFGRGSLGGGPKFWKGTPFYFRTPVIGAAFRALRASQEKRTWLSIARRIVDERCRS